jgi:hypothetical protein
MLPKVVFDKTAFVEFLKLLITLNKTLMKQILKNQNPKENPYQRKDFKNLKKKTANQNQIFVISPIKNLYLDIQIYRQSKHLPMYFYSL